MEHKLKGIIIYFQKQNGTPFYVYMPFDLYDEQDINEWFEEEIRKYESEPYEYTYIKMLCWKLEKKSCVLVCRNKEWFKQNIEEMENFWKLIEYERINGYEHRQPNRRTVITVNKTGPELSTKCNSIPSLNLMFKNNKEQPKCLLKISKIN